MSDSLSTAGINPNAYMQQVRTELEEAQIQELVDVMTRKCFDACVKPNSSELKSGEQACISKCVDRYREAMIVVSHSLARTATRE